MRSNIGRDFLRLIDNTLTINFIKSSTKYHQGELSCMDNVKVQSPATTDESLTKQDQVKVEMKAQQELQKDR